MGRPLGAAQRIARQLELRVARCTGFDLLALDPIPKRLVDDARIGFIADDPVDLRVKPWSPREATPLGFIKSR